MPPKRRAAPARLPQLPQLPRELVNKVYAMADLPTYLRARGQSRIARANRKLARVAHGLDEYENYSNDGVDADSIIETARFVRAIRRHYAKMKPANTGDPVDTRAFLVAALRNRVDGQWVYDHLELKPRMTLNAVIHRVLLWASQVERYGKPLVDALDDVPATLRWQAGKRFRRAIHQDHVRLVQPGQAAQRRTQRIARRANRRAAGSMNFTV